MKRPASSTFVESICLLFHENVSSSAASVCLTPPLFFLLLILNIWRSFWRLFRFYTVAISDTTPISVRHQRLTWISWVREMLSSTDMSARYLRLKVLNSCSCDREFENYCSRSLALLGFDEYFVRICRHIKLSTERKHVRQRGASSAFRSSTDHRKANTK